jgi:hypothetical protein
MRRKRIQELEAQIQNLRNVYSSCISQWLTQYLKIALSERFILKNIPPPPPSSILQGRGRRHVRGMRKGAKSFI